MILVADCGGTKADWALLQAKTGDKVVTTPGFNPVVHPPAQFEDVVGQLSKDELPYARPDKVFYYGAGAWDYRRKELIKDTLLGAWPQADVEVMHDLLGAARATCGHEAGISCILGTGSNSCLYDGQEVIDNVTNLGYLLGDEGSGCHLGKALLRAYFYRELDEDLTQSFEQYAQVDRATVRDTVYDSPNPNTYLASFTRFMGEHLQHPLIQDLILDSFGEFLDRHVRKYDSHLSLPINFIGSIAFHFKEVLLAAMASRNLRAGRFVPKPIQALADFHRPDLNV
ncbi:MAG: hypothetical protein AAF433_21235 [Bacteroidota bacterium]